MQTAAHGRISKVTVGGSDAWYMIGHAYFDRAFSEHFRQILEDEYDLPQTRDKLWEELYVDHIKELDMSIMRYNPPIIHEFDSLDELQDFDPLFLENLDSEIFDNIVAVLGCEKTEIRNVYPSSRGSPTLAAISQPMTASGSIGTPALEPSCSSTAKQRKPHLKPQRS